jgi:hypothetical protein
MVELETINLLVQIVGVSAAAIATVIGVRSYIVSNKRAEEARKRELETRQAQLLMQIYEQVNNREFQKDFSETLWYWKYDGWDDYFEKYGSKIDEYLKLIHIVNTYNGIGAVLENKLVDSGMLFQIVGRDVLRYWDKFGLMVKHWSEAAGDVKNMSKVQLLYDEMGRLYESDVGHRFGSMIKSVDDGRSTLVGRIEPESR